jgi:threonine dehydrogenase-like Zn-dependent dehydrogenase
MKEIDKLTEGINTEDILLQPLNTGVLLKFYDENPYKYIDKTESGLIVGAESTKRYNSNETGEMEQNIHVIKCAKVIAVGPKCENVQIGEDVFVMMAHCVPVPFRKKGYYILHEQNITCRAIPYSRIGVRGNDGPN